MPQCPTIFWRKNEFILIKSLIFSKIQSNKVLLVGGKGVLTPFRRPAPRKSGTFGSFGYKRTFTQSLTLKKYNLNRFILICIKQNSPHPFRFAQHLLHRGEGFKTLPLDLRLPPSISWAALKPRFFYIKYKFIVGLNLRIFYNIFSKVVS